MQALFINQIVLGQGMNQHAAAIDDDVQAGLGFQAAYFLDHMAANQGGVAPGRGRGQGGGNHVLRHAVHEIAKRVTGWHGFKCPAVDLPGFAPQQQRVTVAHFLKEVRANVIMPERSGPPAVGEAALGIFFCPTRRLHDSVQRHKL